MKPAAKKPAAAESVAAPVAEESTPQRCAIGDVQSMKGTLDDHVLHLLETKYGGLWSNFAAAAAAAASAADCGGGFDNHDDSGDDPHPRAAGCKIDYRFSNIRLSLGAIAGDHLETLPAPLYQSILKPRVMIANSCPSL